MILREEKTKKIISENGDLLISDLASSDAEIYYDGTSFYMIPEDEKILMELEDWEEKWLKKVLDENNIPEINGVYMIESKYLND